MRQTIHCTQMITRYTPKEWIQYLIGKWIQQVAVAKPLRSHRVVQNAETIGMTHSAEENLGKDKYRSHIFWKNTKTFITTLVLSEAMNENNVIQKSEGLMGV